MTIYPMFFELHLSFHEFGGEQLGGVAEPIFIGLDNYVKMFSDDYVIKAFQTTFITVFSVVFIEFFFGFGIALLLSEDIKGKTIFRGMMTLPMILSPIVGGYIFKFMLEAYGVVNFFLSLLNIPAHAWLSEPNTALPSIILIDVWQWTPFIFLVLFAAIQSLPLDIYEAAEIDGATGWKKFRYITLPLLSPVIVLAILLRLIDAFKLFDIIYISTKGGPGFLTEVLSMKLYHLTRFVELGYAAAVAEIFFIVIDILAVIMIIFLNRARGIR